MEEHLAIKTTLYMEHKYFKIELVLIFIKANMCVIYFVPWTIQHFSGIIIFMCRLI